MDQTRALDHPNRRFANARGKLTFTAPNVGPTPFDRNIIYGFEVVFDCRTEGGSRTGEIGVHTIVDPPFVDEPGFLEGLADFFLGPLNLSRGIEDGLRAALRGSGGATPVEKRGPCRSIGARSDPDPELFRFDAFVWDVPPPPLPRPLAPVTSLQGRTATLFIDSITRKKTFEKGPSTEPLRFTVFVNGSVGLIPRLGTVSLPPSGGTHTQTYCKTVNVEGLDNLQILFVDSLGGTVWSQFPKRADYGNGPSRTMTTGRQFFEAPNPVPGGPNVAGGDKPQSFIAREFEVRYRIVFQPPVIAPTTTGGLGGTHVGPAGTVGTVSGGGTPAPPCTRI
jgi:hypothetical protein